MKPLRKTYKFPGLIAQTDLSIVSGSRLRAKVLVFERVTDLRKFWKEHVISYPLGKCFAAVTGRMTEVQTVKADGSWKRRVGELDRRYFCVIGLARRHLETEVIVHESVHAGFCYAKRAAKKPWLEVGDFDEEEICYPAGRVAHKLNHWLHAAGLYGRKT